MLDDKEISHREALQKQMQGYTNKFGELAQGHAADKAAEIQRLREELQAQKAEMANLKASLSQFYD